MGITSTCSKKSSLPNYTLKELHKPRKFYNPSLNAIWILKLTALSNNKCGFLYFCCYSYAIWKILGLC